MKEIVLTTKITGTVSQRCFTSTITNTNNIIGLETTAMVRKEILRTEKDKDNTNHTKTRLGRDRCSTSLLNSVIDLCYLFNISCDLSWHLQPGTLQNSTITMGQQWPRTMQHCWMLQFVKITLNATWVLVTSTLWNESSGNKNVVHILSKLEPWYILAMQIRLNQLFMGLRG